MAYGTDKLRNCVSVILPLCLISVVWKMVTGFGTIIGVSPKTLAYVETCVYSLCITGSLIGIVSVLSSEIKSLKFKLEVMKCKLDREKCKLNDYKYVYDE